MECQYCKSILKTHWNLINHQKTAKYCLKLQDKKSNSNDKNLCNFCGAVLSTRQRLLSHVQICSANTPYVQTLIKNYENKIASLEMELENKIIQLRMYKELSERELSCIEEIAKQPRNQTNNTNNTQNTLINMTPLDISKEQFSKCIHQNFTKDYMLDGQKGVARFAVDKLLKDENGRLKYICTDPSRQIYRFKTIDGSIERDIKAKKLTNALAENLTKKSRYITAEEINTGDTDVFVLYNSNFQDIKDMVEDNGAFRVELASLTTQR